MDLDGDNSDLDEFIVDDDEVNASSGARKGKSSADTRRKKHALQGNAEDGAEYAWEGAFQRSWDVVQEDASGSLAGVVNEFVEKSKRRRLLRDTDTIQRGLIRHIYLVLDLSLAMTDRDLRPSRLELTLQYAQEFINEFFDQNPISQLGIIGMKDGIAERVSPLSGNSVDHIKALSNKRKLEPSGEPSLQNALEMARSSLAHLPSHGSREVLVVFGSLTTCDPGNIHNTVDACIKDKLRVNIIGLSAEMAICKTIAKQTEGTYGVVVNEPHFKDLLFECVPPPASSAQPTRSPSKSTPGADLMQMGFPTMLANRQYPTLCSCHSRLKTSGFICPRCKSQVCEIPTECGVCGLTIVSSPHLARSYRHLFPVKNFIEVSLPLAEDVSPDCHSCAHAFREVSTSEEPTSTEEQTLSATGRYACPSCKKHFCLDCDTFVHEVLAVCPGCH